MKKEDQNMVIESEVMKKDDWQKPELTVLDVESTKGGPGFLDELSTNNTS